MGFQDSAGGENWLIEAGPTGIGIFNDNDSATALFINNNEFVGVGTNAPAHLFVVGNSQLFNISSTGEVNISGGMRVDSGTLFVDAATNKVGIGTSTPGTTLEVAGNINVSMNVSLTAGGKFGRENASCNFLSSPNGLMVIHVCN